MSFLLSLKKKTVEELKRELPEYIFLEGHLSEHYDIICPVIEYLSTVQENGEYIFDLNYLLYFLITNINHENEQVVVLLKAIIGERMLQSGYIEEGLTFMQENYAHKKYYIIKAKLLLAMHKFKQAHNLLIEMEKCDEQRRLIFICNIYLNKKIESNTVYSDIYDMIVKVHYDMVTVTEYISYINSRKEELHTDGVYFLLLDFSIQLRENKILNILRSYSRICIKKLSELLSEDTVVLKMNINAMIQSNKLYGKLTGDVIEVY